MQFIYCADRAAVRALLLKYDHIGKVRSRAKLATVPSVMQHCPVMHVFVIFGGGRDMIRERLREIFKTEEENLFSSSADVQVWEDD